MSEAAPLKILNVDDDAANRYALSRILQKAGYAVQEAENGAEALRLAAEAPALILLDIKLPDISGFEVCRRLKADPNLRVIPVLHLSASYVSSADRAHGLEGGADGYLIKPVASVELLATIHALLRLRQAEEEARASAREWSATFEAIGDAVCLLDAQGAVRRGNLAFAELFAQSRELLIGRRFTDLFAARFGPVPLPDIEAARQSGLRIREVLDVPERSLWIAIDAVVDEQREHNRVVVILVDITERRRMQREEQRRQSEIEDLNVLLRRSMAETHHRVKNNLQVISALVDMQVMDDAATVPISEWKRLGIHIRTLAAVHDLLTAAVKTDAGSDAISVEAALSRLLPMVQATLGERRLKATVEDTLVPARLLGSLTILINELVSNAVKHGRGDIEISFTLAGDEMRLEVCDDGPGFPPGFDPRRAAHTGLELIDSTGRHDLRGLIAYTNREQGGARVIVTMPRPADP